MPLMWLLDDVYDKSLAAFAGQTFIVIYGQIIAAVGDKAPPVPVQAAWLAKDGATFETAKTKITLHPDENDEGAEPEIGVW